MKCREQNVHRKASLWLNDTERERGAFDLWMWAEQNNSSEFIHQISSSTHRLRALCSKTGPGDLICSVFGDFSHRHQPCCNFPLRHSKSVSPVPENAADNAKNTGICIGEYTSLCTSQIPCKLLALKPYPALFQIAQLALTDVTYLKSVFLCSSTKVLRRFVVPPLVTTTFKGSVGFALLPSLVYVWAKSCMFFNEAIGEDIRSQILFYLAVKE